MGLAQFINKHRNYIWENNLEEYYSVMFNTPLHTRYFLKKLVGKKPNILEIISYFIWGFMTVEGKNKSEKAILWLKTQIIGGYFKERISNQAIIDYKA